MSSNRIAKRIRYALRWMPDELYIQLNYFGHFHKFANLKNPQTYNEKLNWLKLHDRNPIYTKLVDKYEVKPIIAEIIGNEYIIPTLGVWDFFDEIDFDYLPNQFVLKCTHDSEGVVVVKDKNKLDKAMAREKLENALNKNFYYIGREWPYKDIKPRIIAEKYMEDITDGELRDYKFFCFDGEVKALFVATERQKREEPFFTFFDQDYNPLPIKQGHPVSPVIPQKPACFDEMKKVASTLSQGLTHVRVDLYEANSKVYFGEMTFYHFGAVVPFEPREWDLRFGEWIKLHF